MLKNKLSLLNDWKVMNDWKVDFYEEIESRTIQSINESAETASKYYRQETETLSLLKFKKISKPKSFYFNRLPKIPSIKGKTCRLERWMNGAKKDGT